MDSVWRYENTICQSFCKRAHLAVHDDYVLVCSATISCENIKVFNIKVFFLGGCLIRYGKINIEFEIKSIFYNFY